MKKDKKFMVRDAKIVNREYLFKKKEAFHKAQAKLPFEEKIKILIELQKIAVNSPSCRNKKSLIWQI